MNLFIEIIITLALVWIGVAVLKYCLLTTYTVGEYETAVLFRHGKLLRVLEAGRHRLLGAGYSLTRLDPRWTELSLSGQEFLTADRAGVRISAVVSYRIVEPLTYLEASGCPEAVLHSAAQVALRDVVGGHELAAVIDRKSGLGEEITTALKTEASALGIEIGRAAIRDLSLAGDLRRIYTEALTARERSKITLEEARAEAAAIRTLANAARVFESHPALLELKFLEALEKADGNLAQPLALGTANHWLSFLNKK